MLIPENIKIYFYLPPTDMRKSIDTLCILIADVLKMNPASGQLFLFRSRQEIKLRLCIISQTVSHYGIGDWRKVNLSFLRIKMARLK